MITYWKSAIFFSGAFSEDMIVYLWSQKTHLTDLLELMRSVGRTSLLQLFSRFLNHPFLLPCWIILPLVFPILTKPKLPHFTLHPPPAETTFFLFLYNKTSLQELTLAWSHLCSCKLDSLCPTPLTIAHVRDANAFPVAESKLYFRPQLEVALEAMDSSFLLKTLSPLGFSYHVHLSFLPLWCPFSLLVLLFLTSEHWHASGPSTGPLPCLFICFLPRKFHLALCFYGLSLCMIIIPVTSKFIFLPVISFWILDSHCLMPTWHFHLDSKGGGHIKPSKS